MFPKKQHHWLRMWLGLLLGLAIVFLPHPTPVKAQITQAIVQEIVDGESVFIEEQPAQVDAVATFQQKISTQEARASLLFSNGAAGRLGPQSTVIVGQCIEVKQGLLLASGPANGCTANFDIGVQGTIYIVEVDDKGEAQVKVLEGEITVNPLKTDTTTPTDPTTPETTTGPSPGEATATGSQSPIAVKAGEKVTISPEGALGDIAELLQSDVEGILNGVLFQGFQLELPGMGLLQSALQNLYPNISLPGLPGFNIPVSIPGVPF